MHRLSFGLLLLLLAALAAGPAAGSQHGIRPVRLRCEYAVNPLGLDVPRPRLQWALAAAQAGERGQRQAAYRVQAASSPQALRSGKADLWDSGRVRSADTLGVAYGGRLLRPGERAWWRVRVWDARGHGSDWSGAAWWETGLLEAKHWRAKWITPSAPGPRTEREFYGEDPAPLFRTEFRVERPVARARVYVSGLGYYELRLNGRRVGDHVLDPAWTTYSKRVFYSTYDVTAALRPGANALGALVGYGWYNPLPLRLFGRFNLREHLPVGRPRLVAQLEIQYVDGTVQRVMTDPSWRWADGSVRKNSVYLGEWYDARKEQSGWDRPGFADAAWQPAVLSTEPVGPLEAQPLPPIRVMQDLPARKVTTPKPGVHIVDLGQNFAGWISLRLRNPAPGTQVVLRYGELLYPDGTLNPMTSVMGQIKNRRANAEIGAPVTAWQEDHYVARGGAEERWSPRFTFHGFRYVEVTGLPEPPPLDTVTGHLLHSAVEPAGSFTCSNRLLNRIQELVLWAQRSNMFSVQSDCPHREKLGYGGDIVAASEMALLNFDMQRFYAKTVRDFADAVRPNGGFPETAPYVGIADQGLGEGSGPVGWGTAHPLLCWQLYQYHGDRRLLAEQYPAAARWLALLRSKAVDHILDNGISDHESLAPKPVALTGTAFYYLNARLLERMAGVLGKADEARAHRKLAAEIWGAFNRRFLAPQTGRYDTATQACQAFALHLSLVPRQEEGAAQQVLIDDILDARAGHLSTGIFGTKYLLSALTEGGRADVAYTVVNQRTFPGWGFMVESGATTLWEHWAFSDNTYSHNHPMFGSVSEWFYRALAGINVAPEAVGASRFVLRPQPVDDLQWVKAHYDSVRGRVSSAWKRVRGRLTWDVSLPPNTTALVFVPARLEAVVREGGNPAERAPGLRFRFRTPDAAVFEAGSGSYRFEVR